MKAVAASNIGQYEKSVLALGDYYRTVELGLAACFRKPAPSVAEQRKPKVDGSIGAIVFGSDQGLIGQFNDVIADFAVKTMATLTEKPKVWAVGVRVGAQLENAGLTPLGTFTVPVSVVAITPLVGQMLLKTETRNGQGEINELHLFYNRPSSGSSYAPVHQR